MRKTVAVAALSVILSAPAVWAQDTREETSGTTTTRAEDVGASALKEETVGVRPQIGALVYQDSAGDDTSRGAYGLTIDMNAMSLFSDSSTWYVGPSTGVIFSHLGPPGASFFGSADGGQGGNANLVIVPANLKIGYHLSDNFRIGAHGGGNAIYRSVENSVALGQTVSGTDAQWGFFPNAGLDLELGLGQSMALTLRPDVTITRGDEMFTGTLALAIPIG